MKLKLLLICILIIENVYSENRIVRVSNGLVRGAYSKNYIAFKGIPYAEKPIGEKRFEPVQLFDENWTGVRNATEFGPKCLQWSHFPNSNGERLFGSEDCLYLNVFMKYPKINEKLPVVVYIHGGAFMFGDSEFLYPDILFKKDIVFVSIAYRLGPLGFLSTEDDVVPGNMGLKDQVIALKWIKKNIEAFGGDPDNIILSGFSAGGASVHLHYMSDLSKGLFAKGISHSGCALNPWVIAENSAKKLVQISETLNCPSTSNRNMIDCLKTLPAKDIVKTVPMFLPVLDNPFSPFAVVVEKPSPSAFLTDFPFTLLSLGLISPLPWIGSVVSSDGLYPAAAFLKDDSLKLINDNWNKSAPHILDFDGTIDGSLVKDNVSNQIKTQYLGNKSISEKTFFELEQMMTDRIFVVDMKKAVRLQANLNLAPVYLYYYKYPSKTGLAQGMSERKEYDFGTCHGDDVLLFYENGLRPFLTEPEIIMSEKFVTMYETFAYGQPYFGSTKFISANAVEDFLNYLKIENPDDISMSSDDFGNESFWNGLPFNENN